MFPIRRYYAIEEFAMKLADVEVEAKTIRNAISGNWSNGYLAIEYQQAILELMQDGLVRPQNQGVFAKLKQEDEFHFIKIEDEPEVLTDGNYIIDTLTTKVYTEDVMKWHKEQEQLVNSKLAETDQDDNAPYAELIANVNKLLIGEHPQQAEELRIAVIAWANASSQVQDGHANKGVIKLLTDEIEKVSDTLPDATVKRIAQVSNWNKKGSIDFK